MQAAEVQGGGMRTEGWMVPANLWWLRARSFCTRIARLGRSSPRRLRLTETLPLGERRFVAVLEYDRSRFLLGGTASSLVLLARLEEEEEEEQESDSGHDVALTAAKTTEAGRP